MCDTSKKDIITFIIQKGAKLSKEMFMTLLQYTNNFNNILNPDNNNKFDNAYSKYLAKNKIKKLWRKSRNKRRTTSACFLNSVLPPELTNIVIRKSLPIYKSTF